MKRREFLVAGGALLGMPLAGCVSCRESSLAVPAGTELIDVHCHIFNASDLPQVRFIRYAMLHLYPGPATKAVEDPDLLDGLLDFLTRFVLRQVGAPSAKEEIAVLDGEEAVPIYADDDANDGEFIKAVAFFLKSSERDIKGLAPSKGLDTVRQAILQAGAGEELYEKAELGDLKAQEIATKAFLSNFIVGRALRWFRLFTRYRYVLVDKLAAQHALQGFKPLLLAPAAVDYDNWLGEMMDEPSGKSPMPDQIKVMGRIARRPSGPAVHGYVGFDPLRQVLFDEGLRTDYNPLEVVADAINDEGFIGAKVYPPMGFRALTNDDDVCRTYPDSTTFGQLLARLPNDPAPEHCSPLPRDGSRALSKRLDEAMGRLFDLCASRHACVLAHANNSNGANKNYGEFADPAFWLPVFGQWPSLHVCLAHFGHFDSRSAAAPTASNPPEASWEWAFGHYLKDHPSAPVYMDVSYFTEMFDKSGGELDEYTATLREWLEMFDPECRHLMFGTDWVMLGIHPSYPTYSSDVYNYFRYKVGLDGARMQRLFVGNAIAFLGLQPGMPQRTRLEAFYKSNGLPADRLPTFSI